MVSSSRKTARNKLPIRTAALKMVGRAKGYARIHATPCGSSDMFKIPDGPKNHGRLTIGSARQPPNASPITTPELKTNGRSKNARLWYFRSTTISAVMVRMTPMLPFPMPASTRQHITAGSVVEKPKPIFDAIDSSKPKMIVVFLP